MAQRKLEIIIDADGKKAVKEMDRISKKAGKTGKNIGAAIKKGALIGAAAITTLVFAMSKAVAAANEQEAAEKSLEVALGGTSQALLDQASALQKVTAFGDETIIKAQALIAAFVKDEDQIKAATAATLDLAAAKGFDLVTAADLVSKTLGSSTNALSRYGIEVKGAVGSTDRLASLTGNLEKVFGGQAVGQVETFGGATTQLANSFGDLLENIGFYITKNPVMIGAVQSLTKVFGELSAAMGVSTERDAFDIHTDRINQLQGSLNNLREIYARTGRGAEGLAAIQRQIAEENATFKEGILATAAAHKAEEAAIISKGEAQIAAAQAVPARREELTGEAEGEFPEIVRLQELNQMKLNELASFQEQELQMAITHGASIQEQERIRAEQAREFAKVESGFRLKTAARTAGALANVAQNLNTALGGKSKTAFKAMKAFALAEAAISGGRAVVSSYAAGSAIGGPILGAAFAAAAAIATAAQIQQIKSQQLGGGGGAISVGGSATPTRTGGGQSAQGIPVRIEEDQAKSKQEINITFQADGIIAKDTLAQMSEDLIKTINEAGDRNLLINATAIAT